MKILMVCLGNICRSPLAHAILEKNTSDIIFVDSAGTSNYHIDSLPDSRMIEKGKEYGYDLTKLRARQFQEEDFKKFDLILAMDNDNYKHLIKMVKNPDDLQKVKLFLSNDQDVPDPYFGKADGFEAVYKIINEECQRLANKLDV
jgi:protein-tyrosine phosphatase